MRFALLTLFSILSSASAEVVECSYDGGCQGPGCRWTRLYNAMEGAQRDLGGNVTLMLKRALLVEERVIALVFARLWVAVGLPENAKLLSSR